MILRKIIENCKITDSMENNILNAVDISGISYNSRQIKHDWLFVAIRGEKFDGHNFIQDAIQKGAVAIVHEKQFNKEQIKSFNPLDSEQIPIVFIRVENSRKELACISNNFYGKPSEKLNLIGITGTNGKTTITYILKSILELWERKVGLIGTIQYMIGDDIFPAIHTTPESPEFQHLLKDMLDAGCTHVISEVSSHALAQYRVDGAKFKAAVFTNLTRDHLDFHKTMENYFQAKRRLFVELLSSDGAAIINIDDIFGKQLYSELLPVRWLSSTLNILTFGLQPGSDITASKINFSYNGMNFLLQINDETIEIDTSLIGMFNVYNIMAAAGAAKSMNVPLNIIAEGINNTEIVPGRFEKIDMGQDFLCIVDYAHTEDALERLIITARELLDFNASKNLLISKKGGIITVFGCGGDRDKGKRPAMGRAATSLSDFVIITSDNPRTEDPLEIIDDIEKGVVNKNYIIEPDREKAIIKAINMAKTGDIVLIAGKGHEDYQEIQGIKKHFSDKEIAKEAITKRL